MATIVGTLGDDNQIIDLFNADDVIFGDTLGLLLATGGNDRIFARGGFDEVSGDADTIGPKGRGGNDLIYGGDDDDTIYGDASGQMFGIGGNDIIYQQGGVGRIVGDADDMDPGARGGNDRLYGTGTLIGDSDDDTDGSICGNDLLDATSATDESTLIGDVSGELNGASRGGRDTLYGGTFADNLYGDASGNLEDTAIGGNDKLWGRGGDDDLYGDTQEGMDELSVGGDDVLRGGTGDDRLFGDAGEGLDDFSVGGDDNLYGGTGNDQLWGDGELLDDIGDLPTGGRDRFHFGGGFGQDIAFDFRQGEDQLVFHDLVASDLVITLDAGSTVVSTLSGDSVTLDGFTSPLTKGIDLIFV